jgi:hypothetical protein
LLDGIIVQGALEALRDDEIESTPEEAHHSSSKRAKHDMPQRLRFTSFDNRFSIVDEQGIWFYSDVAFTLKSPVKCYLLCLISEASQSHYQWWLHGLVLWDASEQVADPPRLERLGAFMAREVSACSIARHQMCGANGCDLPKMETRGDARTIFVQGCDSFMEDTTTTRIVPV